MPARNCPDACRHSKLSRQAQAEVGAVMLLCRKVFALAISCWLVGAGVATAELTDAGAGSYAYLRKMRELPKEIASGSGFDTFCSAVPWKFLLTPNTTTPEQRESYVRTHPNVDLNAMISVFTTVRSLDLDREWIERPCDKGFWPVTFVRQKR